jgi:hypothetical protein
VLVFRKNGTARPVSISIRPAVSPIPSGALISYSSAHRPTRATQSRLAVNCKPPPLWRFYSLDGCKGNSTVISSDSRRSTCMRVD